MMASIGSTFPHPGGGMQQHPGGPPGHPMAPAMAHNQSQPGTQPGMPPHLAAHMGVLAPGGQMNQAALMGGAMQPGAGGANAHPMQHMNPSMFQQQMNPMFNNSLMQQQLSHQQRLQHLQQQQQQQNMGRMMHQQGYPQNMGIPLQIQQAQMQAALQQRARMQAQQASHSFPPHQQPQFLSPQHMQLMQQQQQQQAQMGQHGNPAALMAQQQQQILAMQQAQQQAAHDQAQQHGQQQQAQQSQQQPGGPLPPIAPLQANSGSAGANGAPQAQGPVSRPTPQPNPGQQPQAPPQTPQQTPLQQAQMAQLQAQSQMVNPALSRQKQEIKGQCLLKLQLFGEQLSGGLPGHKSGDRDDLSGWNEFVQKFFSAQAVFRLILHPASSTKTTSDEQADDPRYYDLPYPALARFFRTYFDSGVYKIQLILEQSTTDRPLQNEGHFIENSSASFVYWFHGGGQVVQSGMLRAQFDSEQKFDMLEFTAKTFDEYISRGMVLEAAKPQHNWIKEWKKVNSSDVKQSPEMSKKGRPKPTTMKSPQQPPPELDVPDALVGSLGVPGSMSQFLEFAEIMCQMNPIFKHYHNNPTQGPFQVIQEIFGLHGGAPGGLNGQVAPSGGPRTPSYGNQFTMQSPAMAHPMLPASPHFGSPALGHMQAPAMQMQQSQQGATSSNANINTSPSQNNLNNPGKRRRPSGVKDEDTPGLAQTPMATSTPQMNGHPHKTKPPTPRMPNQKRIKTNLAA